MTRAAFHGAMRAKQRELRFGVVEAIHVSPGAGVVASFATERSAVSAKLCHTVIEFALVRIFVTAGTGQIVPTKRKDPVEAARSARFVAFVARDGSMRASKRITRLAVHGHGIGRDVEVPNGVAVLAAVLMRRRNELAVVLILVAVQTSGKLHFVNRVFACGKMAFGAVDFDVFALERVVGSVVFFHAEERRLPAFHGVAFGAFAFLWARLKLAFVRIGFVTVVAIAERQRLLEVAIEMAIGASNGGVFAKERIFRF